MKKRGDVRKSHTQGLCRQCAEGRRKSEDEGGVPFVLLEFRAPKRRNKYGWAAKVKCDQCGPTHIGRDGRCVGDCRFSYMHTPVLEQMDRAERRRLGAEQRQASRARHMRLAGAR